VHNPFKALVGVCAAFCVVTAMFASNVAMADVTGAGSTFVYPLLAKWADAYKTKSGITINYQSIGSGGGIKQIQNKTVDFGASDMPLTAEELEKQNLVQFPLINGAVVPIVNLPKVPSLNLTGAILAEIFAGKIKKWNDEALKKINPTAELPDAAISVVHRSDGSGTTFIFSNYLCKVSPTWKTSVGEGTSVNWPTGLGGKGNEGVASYIKQIPNSIGYVEYAFALQNKMQIANMQNKAGKMVEANLKSFKAAAAGADWKSAKSFYLLMTDAAGENSWPITGSTFVLMQKELKNQHTLEFFRWAYSSGVSDAEQLHYVPVPSALVKSIEKTWKDNFKGI
jgi:phosphate transport system substrate-binding protein